MQHPYDGRRHRAQGIPKAKVADERRTLGNKNDGNERHERAQPALLEPAQIGNLSRAHIAIGTGGHGAALPRAHRRAPEGTADATSTDADVAAAWGSDTGTEMRPSSSSP